MFQSFDKLIKINQIVLFRASSFPVIRISIKGYENVDGWNILQTTNMMDIYMFLMVIN